MSICPDCLQCADCGAWYACTSTPGHLIPCLHGEPLCWDCAIEGCTECRADDAHDQWLRAYDYEKRATR